MREGIHPEYHQATVTCNCGNTFVTGSTKRTSTLRSAPSAIRSIRDSRKQRRHAAVLISSTRNTVLNKKRHSRLRWKHLSLFVIWRNYEVIKYRRAGCAGRHHDAQRRQVFGCGPQAGRGDHGRCPGLSQHCPVEIRSLRSLSYAVYSALSIRLCWE